MSDFRNGTCDKSYSDGAFRNEGGGTGNETCSDEAFRDDGNPAKDEHERDGRRRSGAGGMGGTRYHSRGSIFDSLFDDDYDERDDEIDVEMERFFRGLNAIEARLSHATEALFGMLMSRSMGCANFTAVTIALLVCTRVIGAVFVDVDALCELNALAFAVSLAVLVVCAVSERCPANALSAVVIACLPALIEIITAGTVHGSDADVFVHIITGALLGIGAGAALTVVSSLVSDCEDENVACTRILTGPLWGAAIGATAALVCDIAPYIAREITFGVEPLCMSYMQLAI